MIDQLIEDILEEHKKWLVDKKQGARANLTGANLTRANLPGADLRWADLRWANLRWANLSGADLHWAYLSWANLTGADLTEASLHWANLTGADLTEANLIGADLTEANLSGADLTVANLSGANLTGANLTRANLTGANLTEAKGLLDPSKWMAENFKSDDLGYFVYKAIYNTTYDIPSYWIIKAGSFLEEVPNRCPTDICGCGVNFATLAWAEQYTKSSIWLCRIHWKDLPSVVVPYNTDGKARCTRLELIEKIKGEK